MERRIKFSGFILKILGAIFMTLDHIGIFLANYENTIQIADIFRKLGRLALPIFIFLIVEGVLHTSNYKKYVLRLLLLEGIFLIGQIIFYYFINNSISSFYSPIIDLILVSLVIHFINKKNKYSFFAILPVVYLILSFIVINIEKANDITILWMPFFIRSAYSVYSLILGLGFYLSYPVAKYLIQSNSNLSAFEGTYLERNTINILSALTILVITTVFALIYKYTNVSYMFDSNQAFGIAALLPILFYSGERGYNSKWFKYGSYLYVPLHILIIFLIFSLI